MKRKLVGLRRPSGGLGIRGVALATCLIAGFTIFTVPLQASTLEIQFTGLDLDYDGNNLFDSGVHNTTGSGNPAQSDVLTSMNFYVDGSLVGVLNTDVYADVYIANIGALPVGGGLFNSLGFGGMFGVDLLTSNDLPGWALALNID